MTKVKIETVIEVLESFPKQLDLPKPMDQIQDKNFKIFVWDVTNENTFKKEEALNLN